jgi:E1A/CREB-binding protein
MVVCLQGDDYVIYCHPSKQKNPRASHLREWYHILLDEAARRGIVSFRSSLYDSFFEGGKDHALTGVSSRRLPYFDGDFWPGEAETRLNEISSKKAPASASPGYCHWSSGHVVDRFCCEACLALVVTLLDMRACCFL